MLASYKKLGKGLSSLLGNKADLNFDNKKENGLLLIPIEKIFRDEKQPRKEFDKEKIEELAQSISKNGLIQPLILIKNDNILALASPSGIGAISLIRVSGPESILIVDKIFRGVEKIKLLTDEKLTQQELEKDDNIVVECLLTDQSDLVGRSLMSGNFRQRFGKIQ